MRHGHVISAIRFLFVDWGCQFIYCESVSNHKLNGNICDEVLFETRVTFLIIFLFEMVDVQLYNRNEFSQAIQISLAVSMVDKFQMNISDKKHYAN